MQANDAEVRAPTVELQFRSCQRQGETLLHSCVLHKPFLYITVVFECFINLIIKKSLEGDKVFLNVTILYILSFCSIQNVFTHLYSIIHF